MAKPVSEAKASDQPVTLTPVAVARSYSDVLRALLLEKDRTGKTFLELDHESGLATGYSAKIFCPEGRRRLGVVSTPLLLRALGLVLVIARAPEDARLPPVGQQEFKAKEAS